MRYLTGIHALNLNCALETCGDWHQSALRWENLSWKESEASVFRTYGIEHHRNVPFAGLFDISIANHIRALLDLLEDGKFAQAQGMNDDFICNQKYDAEVFRKVYELRDSALWPEISAFMGHEYHLAWLRFLRDVRAGNLQDQAPGSD